MGYSNYENALELGNPVTIHVHRTGKAAPGRVVFASYEPSRHFGVELDKPANIWGLTDAPSRNGQRFLLTASPRETTPTFEVLVNWPALLKRK